MNDHAWFAEGSGGNEIIQYRYRRKLFSGASRFQRIDIVDTYDYGRMLFLDGIAQSSERDEFVYHEALVHPALLTHPSPNNVCVIGGAEGATIREVLKHPDIGRVVMVDIDSELVELCKEHLGMLHQGAYDDLRLELHFGDGREFLEENAEKFDVIIVDLSDPVPEGPAVKLFTREFYQLIFDRLSPDGVAAIQGESLQLRRLATHADLVHTVGAVFPITLPYEYYMPCFHELHAIILASKDHDPRILDLGQRILERGLELDYLSPNYMHGLFRVPAYVEKAYREQRRIMTDDHPLVIDPY